MTTRAIIYARVSTNAQEDKGSSLGSQEAACREFALSKGWTVVAVFSGAEGAAYRDRPNLNRVRELIREGGCDVMVCFDLDRLTRDQRDAFILFEEAEAAGVAWEFVRGEPFADTAMGRFVLSARSFAAEVEREQKSERVVRAIETSAKAGRRMPGSAALYGYTWAGEQRERLVANTETGPIVQRVFAEAAGGASIRRIAMSLNEDGVPSPRGVRWSHPAIRNVLRNHNYTGEATALQTTKRATRIAGKRKDIRTNRPSTDQVALPTGTIEALVDGITFAIVQERLDRAKSESSRRTIAPTDALLRTGFGYCGMCGSPVRIHRHNGRPQYRCSRAEDGSRLEKCPNFGIMADRLDDLVWTRVLALMSGSDEAFERWLGGIDPERTGAGADVSDIDAELEKLVRQQAATQRQIEGFVAELAGDDALADDVTAPLRSKVVGIARRVRDLRGERAERTRQDDGISEALAEFRYLREYMGTKDAILSTLTFSQRRDVLRALGVRVDMFRGDAPERFVITARVDLDRYAHLDRWAGWKGAVEGDDDWEPTGAIPPGGMERTLSSSSLASAWCTPSRERGARPG